MADKIDEDALRFGQMLQSYREGAKVLHAHEPPDRIYAELLGYTRPVVSGRTDKRNMKPKSAVWFVYRVA